MEKYKRFADKGTGINPFTPFTPKPLQTAALYLQHAKNYVIGPIVALVRLLLSVVIVVLLFIFGIVIPKLTFWLWPISRSFARGAHAILGHLWLFVLGFYRVEVVPYPFHELPKNAFAFTPTSPQAQFDGSAPLPTNPQQLSPTARDLIIANHCSYIDVLYLAAKYAPLFAFPLADDTARVMYATTLSALWHSSFDRDATLEGRRKPQGAISLSELLMLGKKLHCPVVLFAEGTPTNGRALLQVMLNPPPWP